MPGLPLRAVRHGGQVPQLAALAHEPPAPGHQHQGPPRPPDARPLRPRAGQQAALQGRCQGNECKYQSLYVASGHQVVNSLVVSGFRDRVGCPRLSHRAAPQRPPEAGQQPGDAQPEPVPSASLAPARPPASLQGQGEVRQGQSRGPGGPEAAHVLAPVLALLLLAALCLPHHLLDPGPLAPRLPQLGHHQDLHGDDRPGGRGRHGRNTGSKFPKWRRRSHGARDAALQRQGGQIRQRQGGRRGARERRGERGHERHGGAGPEQRGARL